MNLAEQLERLAKLRAEGSLTLEEFESAKRKTLAAHHFSGYSGYGLWSIRRESARMLFGLPLWSIAIGPDLERGEIRGRARGIFAIGDIATGWVALGGLARGLFAFGGLAIGLVSFGGLSIGVLAAAGGGAIGGFAFGGASVGLIAVGGAAFGYYAFGGAAFGAHAVSGLRQDPEAVEFLHRCLPWIAKLLHR